MPLSIPTVLTRLQKRVREDPYTAMPISEGAPRRANCQKALMQAMDGSITTSRLFQDYPELYLWLDDEKEYFVIYQACQSQSSVEDQHSPSAISVVPLSQRHGQSQGQQPSSLAAFHETFFASIWVQDLTQGDLSLQQTLERLEACQCELEKNMQWILLRKLRELVNRSFVFDQFGTESFRVCVHLFILQQGLIDLRKQVAKLKNKSLRQSLEQSLASVQEQFCEALARNPSAKRISSERKSLDRQSIEKGIIPYAAHDWQNSYQLALQSKPSASEQEAQPFQNFQREALQKGTSIVTFEVVIRESRFKEEEIREHPFLDLHSPFAFSQLRTWLNRMRPTLAWLRGKKVRMLDRAIRTVQKALDLSEKQGDDPLEAVYKALQTFNSTFSFSENGNLTEKGHADRVMNAANVGRASDCFESFLNLYRALSGAVKPLPPEVSPLKAEMVSLLDLARAIEQSILSQTPVLSRSDFKGLFSAIRMIRQAAVLTREKTIDARLTQALRLLGPKVCGTNHSTDSSLAVVLARHIINAMKDKPNFSEIFRNMPIAQDQQTLLLNLRLVREEQESEKILAPKKTPEEEADRLETLFDDYLQLKKEIAEKRLQPDFIKDALGQLDSLDLLMKKWLNQYYYYAAAGQGTVQLERLDSSMQTELSQYDAAAGQGKVDLALALVFFKPELAKKAREVSRELGVEDEIARRSPFARAGEKYQFNSPMPSNMASEIARAIQTKFPKIDEDRLIDFLQDREDREDRARPITTANVSQSVLLRLVQSITKIIIEKKGIADEFKDDLRNLIIGIIKQLIKNERLFVRQPLDQVIRMVQLGLFEKQVLMDPHLCPEWLVDAVSAQNPQLMLCRLIDYPTTFAEWVKSHRAGLLSGIQDSDFPQLIEQVNEALTQYCRVNKINVATSPLEKPVHVKSLETVTQKIQGIRELIQPRLALSRTGSGPFPFFSKDTPHSAGSLSPRALSAVPSFRQPS